MCVPLVNVNMDVFHSLHYIASIHITAPTLSTGIMSHLWASKSIVYQKIDKILVK